MEAELRKAETLRGTPIILGNGETWTISSLPFGPKGDAVGVLIDAMAITAQGDDADKTLDSQFQVMLAITQINYPELTEETAKENGLFLLGEEMFSEMILAMGGLT